MPREIILPSGDLPARDFREHIHRVADWVADYRETIEQRRIAPDAAPGTVAARFPAELPATATSIGDILGQLDADVMPGIVHWGHPAFLGYFGSTSNGPALLGEIVAAALNVSAMTWQTCPAATELETVVLGWIRGMVALPETFTGIVYDTASIGILHALAAAREGCGAAIRAEGIVGRADIPILRVYASDQAHSSIEKAMIVLGLGEANVVRIPSDADVPARCGGAPRADPEGPRRRVSPDGRDRHRRDHVDGQCRSGSRDRARVPRPRRVAPRGRRVWRRPRDPSRRTMGDGRRGAGGFGDRQSAQVDVRPARLQRPLHAAPGTAARGIRADARVPARRRPRRRQLHGLRASARPALSRDEGVDGVQRASGVDGIAARIREHCRLARLWAGWVEEDARFVLAAPVLMGVVCFRYAPAEVDDAACDRLNERIVETIIGSGQAYLTHTTLNGRVVMRVGIGNILTTEAHLERVWAAIVATAANLA